MESTDSNKCMYFVLRLHIAKGKFAAYDQFTAIKNFLTTSTAFSPYMYSFSQTVVKIQKESLKPDSHLRKNVFLFASMVAFQK